MLTADERPELNTENLNKFSVIDPANIFEEALYKVVDQCAVKYMLIYDTHSLNEILTDGATSASNSAISKTHDISEPASSFINNLYKISGSNVLGVDSESPLLFSAQHNLINAKNTLPTKNKIFENIVNNESDTFLNAEEITKSTKTRDMI